MMAVGILASDLRSAEPHVVRLMPPPTTDPRWLPRPLEDRFGEIIDFTPERLVMKTGDQTIELDAKRVVMLDVPAPDGPSAEGITAYRNGDYAAALPPLAAAVKSGPAVWQQRLLAACLIDSAVHAGRESVALELLRNLADSNPPAWIWRYAPIDWIGWMPNAQREAAALQALDDPRTIVRVVVASWLLRGSQRERAEQVLAAAAQDGQNPDIARLADAVLWRLTPVPRIAEQWPKWQRKVNGLSPALQGGPLASAADRLQAAGQSETATAIWLELATQHEDLVSISREARVRVDALLVASGRESDLRAWRAAVPRPSE
jgi:hypothetical protein